MKTNTKGLRGIGNMAIKKAKVYYSADGCCSKVHQSGKTTDRYIVSIPNIPTNVEDPNYGIELFAFEEVKKSERRFHCGDNFGDDGWYTLLKKEKHKDFSIELVFKKQSNGVYIITTQDQLPQGEYIFIDFNNPELRKGNYSDGTNGNNYMTGFCFSVQ